MYCRHCGRAQADAGELDAHSVCASCHQNRAALRNEYYCTHCGNGPGHAHIFDARGVCLNCRRIAPPVVDAPPLRPPRPCAQCEGTAFVRAQLRERGGIPGSTVSIDIPKPFAISYATSKRLGVPSVDMPVGAIEAYVCRGCGYTELYTHDFAEIPIGPEWGTTEFHATGGPFR